MVDNEKIYELYDAMLNVETITTKEIKELGFTSNHITKMVEDGILVRVKRGYYTYGNAYSVAGYAKKLVDSKRRSDAIKLFKIAFELDSTNLFVAYQLFINSVKSKDYDNVLKYYDVMYNADSANKKYLYYLYILSFIIELPEHYKKVVKELKPANLMIVEHDEYTTLINSTINLVFNGKLPLAFSKRSNFHSNHSSTIDDYAEVTLLREAVAANSVVKDAIKKAIKEEDYEKAAELFNKENDKRELPFYQKYVFYLVNDILLIKENNRIEEKEDYIGTSNLFNAIEHYDYERAYELSLEKESNAKAETASTLHVLLERILKLKKELSIDLVQEETSEEVVEEVEEAVVEDNTYESVVRYLLGGDFDKFEQSLLNYLHESANDDYYKTIMYMIKLDKLNEDYTFNDVLVLLTEIASCRYEFNASKFISGFYNEVANKNIEKAKLYLKILGQHDVLAEDVYEAMENILELLDEKIVEVEHNVDVEVNVVDKEDKVEEVPVLQSQDLDLGPVSKKEEYKSNKGEKDLAYIQDEEYIARKVEELNQKRGLVILKPMDSARRARIHEIVKKFPNATTFSIGEGTERRIVIRHLGNVYIPFKETIRIADEAYYKKDYQTALTAYLDLLGTNIPKTYIYAKVGLSYMKLWMINKAIDCLTIATELSKKNGEKFDFSDLLASLNGTEELDEKKPKVNMKEQDFHVADNYFGVVRFEEMLVHKDLNGLSYEGACEELGFTYEEYLLSLLVLARNAFANKEDEKGEKFLKMVERSGNKSEKVKRIFSEVRTNKRFYKNRVVSEGQVFVKKSSE